MIWRRPRVIDVLVAVVVMVATTAIFVPAAEAQIDVVGSADFRNAPALAPGQYRDRIVTGESAWYALVYTNDTPYRFAVSLPGIDLASFPELTLTAEFVAPTLKPEGEPATVLAGDGLSYPNGETNIWFLKVTLASSGTLGVEYPLLIEIEGAESTGFADCAELPGCTLDEEYEVVDSRLRRTQDELADIRLRPQSDDIQIQIENFSGFAEAPLLLLPAAEARLARAEATMAKLCAPEPTCTEFPQPAPATPLVGWALGGIFLIGGGARAVQKLRTPVGDES